VLIAARSRVATCARTDSNRITRATRRAAEDQEVHEFGPLEENEVPEVTLKVVIGGARLQVPRKVASVRVAAIARMIQVAMTAT
jgi:hypothetical protein